MTLADFVLDDTNVYFGYQVIITNNQTNEEDIFVKVTGPALGVENALTLDDSSTDVNEIFTVTAATPLTITFVFKIDETSSETHIAKDLGIGSMFELATTQAELTTEP